ncbi:hypothetical protein DERF_014045 [Dermatophagoides farinae]|uniref:Uncharacterized protein n=1 Tax=Dermatophagoides farinae TaxID=6954 RepID=A0A922KTJ5_DERFA|nr:hypothetical protein DERF_014045 [Dermatophagoides farinae]
MYQEKKHLNWSAIIIRNNPSSTSSTSKIFLLKSIYANNIKQGEHEKKSLSMPNIFINRNRMAYNS